MAQYQDVSWQPDDEATSQKMDQMAQNDRWLYDNIVPGNINYKLGADGSSPFGRTPGNEQAKKMEAIYIPFNSSGASVASMTVSIPYPPVFTFPPICTVTIAQGQGNEFAGVLTQDFSTANAIFKVFWRDGVARPMNGALNVILLGR